MFVFLNGKIIRKEDAKISPFDRGFLFGDGVFETIRCYRGVPFAWQQHVERLKKGLSELSINTDLNEEELKNVVMRLLYINNLSNTDAYLRITVSRGENNDLRDLSSPNPTIFAFVKSINLALLEKKRVLGVNTELTYYHRDVLPHIKHLSYLSSLKSLIDVDADIEPIFTYNNKILEGATSNIFFCKDDVVITPPKGNILEGVMRNLVLDFLKNEGILVQERDILVNEINDISCAFITNSIIEILPVARLSYKNFSLQSANYFIQICTRNIKNMLKYLDNSKQI